MAHVRPPPLVSPVAARTADPVALGPTTADHLVSQTAMQLLNVVVTRRFLELLVPSMSVVLSTGMCSPFRQSRLVTDLVIDSVAQLLNSVTPTVKAAAIVQPNRYVRLQEGPRPRKGLVITSPGLLFAHVASGPSRTLILQNGRT